jgi:serine/threonine-protein kinase HipA
VREPLHLLLHGASIGVLEPLPRNWWQLRYAEAPQAPQAHPLSVSMPLTQTTHPHSVLEPFVWNLMPDNADVLKRWGQRFQVSSRDPLSLLGHVGEDCAGAVQFVRPDRINLSHVRSRFRWLSLEDVESRLRTLRVDRASWRHGDDTGQFSLSGAQPKTALYWDGLRWGIPEGRIPTTHILKPTLPDFDGHAENEHICLALASAVDHPTASRPPRPPHRSAAARPDRGASGWGRQGFTLVAMNWAMAVHMASNSLRRKLTPEKCQSRCGGLSSGCSKKSMMSSWSAV